MNNAQIPLIANKKGRKNTYLYKEKLTRVTQ